MLFQSLILSYSYHNFYLEFTLFVVETIVFRIEVIQVVLFILIQLLFILIQLFEFYTLILQCMLI